MVAGFNIPLKLVLATQTQKRDKRDGQKGGKARWQGAEGDRMEALAASACTLANLREYFFSIDRLWDPIERG